MRILKVIIIIIVVLIVAIQFIRPDRVAVSQSTLNDVSAAISVPAEVQSVLKKSCYDCHSNNPSYPWYFNIQPVGWLLANHISEARKELNFSEFGSYPPKRQYSKLEGLIDEVKDDEMPLASYKLMHKEARLGEDEKKLLMDWAETGKKSIDRN